MKLTRQEIILQEIDECDNNMLKIILERDIARISEDEETYKECMDLIKNEFSNFMKRKEILLQLLDGMTLHTDFVSHIVIINDTE